MFHRKAKEQWRRVMLLLVLSSSLSLINGQRLSQQKCEEYEPITTTRSGVIPLVLTLKLSMHQCSNCSNIVKQIVGGEPANHGEFPHHALLGYPKNDSKEDFDFLCGGTLISELHVMTAAHCFTYEKPTIVRLGEYDTTLTSNEEFDVEIAAVRKHPWYNSSRTYHDIALVKLAKRVMLSPFIRPACLWASEERNITKYIATGFGAYEPYSVIMSTKMIKVQLEEFPVEDCKTMFNGYRRFREGIHDGQLCVGSKFDNRDTCQGDSGGPLQTVINKKTCMYAVVGIISTGKACGVGQSRAVYTKVSYYLDWIEDKVWGPNALWKA